MIRMIAIAAALLGTPAVAAGANPIHSLTCKAALNRAALEFDQTRIFNAYVSGIAVTLMPHLIERGLVSPNADEPRADAFAWVRDDLKRLCDANGNLSIRGHASALVTEFFAE